MTLNYRVTALLESNLELTEITNTGKHTKRIWQSDELIFIELTKGYYTVTEAYNLDDVIECDWTTACAYVKAGIVCRAVSPQYQGSVIGLHQYLTGIGFGEGYAAEVTIDHINREPLDNRIKNFRAATKRQQLMNRTNNNKTGYRGVSTILQWYYEPHTGKKGDRISRSKYTATVRLPSESGEGYGVAIQSPLYDSPKVAALVHDYMALSLVDDFPLEALNDIDSIL